MASSNVNDAVAAAISTRRSASRCRREARAVRLVRLGPLLDDVLSAHDYPAPIARILSEALVLTALLGATLKDAGGQLTLQAQTEAGSSATSWSATIRAARSGAMCASTHNGSRPASLPSLFALFGKGYLAITFDQAMTRERYQGIVLLEAEPRRGGPAFLQPVGADTEPGAARGQRYRPRRRRHPAPASARRRGAATASTRASTIPSGSMSAPSRDDPRQRAGRPGTAAREPALAVPRGRGSAGADPGAARRAAAAPSNMSATSSPASARRSASRWSTTTASSASTAFCSRVFPIRLADLEDGEDSTAPRNRRSARAGRRGRLRRCRPQALRPGLTSSSAMASATSSSEGTDLAQVRSSGRSASRCR